MSWWKKLWGRIRPDHVIAVGRDTYIRFWPNPGVCICWGQRRAAISWYGGLEIFAHHPVLVWRRTFAFLSRVRRPQPKE